MSVKTEKIVIKKYIITVSRTAEERLRRLAIKLAIGFFFLILAVIAMVANFGGEQDTLRLFGNSVISMSGGAILMLYLYFMQRVNRKAKEAAMREAGWDGEQPAEMKVDRSGSLGCD